MAIATSWERVQSQQGAEGSRYFAEFGHARKGSFGAQCFHVTCRNGDARWYNKLDARYYCEDCATKINADCAKRGELLDCSRHL